MFWTVPGIIIAKNIGIGDNGFFDTHYFRSAFAQSMLVALLLLSASQIVSFRLLDCLAVALNTDYLSSGIMVL